MTWFINMVRVKIGDNSGANAETSTSPLMNSWRDYQSFGKHMTPEAYESIWETGQLPEKYQKDDDRKVLTQSDFANTQYSKWKRFTNIRNDIINKLYDNYPGDLHSDVESDLEKIKRAKPLSDSAVLTEIDKIKDELSFKYGNKTVKLLFDDVKKIDINTLRNYVTVYNNSVVARRFAHIAVWLSKIALQTESTAILENTRIHIRDIFKQSNEPAYLEFINHKNISKLSTDIRSQGKSKQKIEEYHAETAKNGVALAMMLLKKAELYAGGVI